MGKILCGSKPYGITGLKKNGQLKNLLWPQTEQINVLATYVRSYWKR